MTNNEIIQKLRRSNKRMCKPNKSDYDLLREAQFSYFIMSIAFSALSIQFLFSSIRGNFPLWLNISMVVFSVGSVIWNIHRYKRADHCRALIAVNCDDLHSDSSAQEELERLAQ